MSQPLALPTFREQDFQAPQSRTVGAGVEGLEEITDLERSECLRRMREGTLGSIHSWELVTAVDGPGTRMTVFLNGCPLRCLYCHNPDTFLMKDGAPVSDTELLSRIARYRRIFRTTKGGITLSGGSWTSRAATRRPTRRRRDAPWHPRSSSVIALLRAVARRASGFVSSSFRA